MINFRKRDVFRPIILFLCMFFGLHFAGFQAQAQVNLSLDLQNVPLEQVLSAIETRTSYRFLYNKEIVDVTRKVSVNVQNKELSVILSQLFAGTDITYTLKNKQIVLGRTSVQQAAKTLKTITGTIVDAAGVPIIGANIIETGTTNGTITDADGKFSLSVNNNATIHISYIGYLEQNIAIAGQSVLNVTLLEDTKALGEVVVVGYGTQKKNAVTGAVAVANIDAYKSVAVNNILETVKGTVAGLNVGGTNQAGAVAGMSIRGINSQTASSDPLIVVDGAIFSGSLADIPTNDIQSFTVLKDASAAAVYGSRSANGVILIETKGGTGIDGKPKFEVRTSYGLSDELEPLKVYDAPGYLQRLLDSREALGQEADPTKIEQYLQVEEQKNYSATPDHKPTLTDPYGLFNQLGYNFNTSLSVSNKTEKNSYYISTNIIKQSGVIINDNYKNITGRINIDSKLTSWFDLGIKSYYSMRDYSGSTIYGQGTSTSGSSPTGFSPYATLKDANGNYLQFPQSTTSYNSPYWQIATDDVDLRNSLNAIVTGTFKVPWVRGLSYTVNWSNTLNWSERNVFWDKNTLDGISRNGQGSRAYSRTYSTLLDNIIKFNRIFFEKHAVDLTLLYSLEQSNWEGLSGTGQDFDYTGLGTYGLQNGKTQTVKTSGGQSKGVGKMGRLTYTYDNKYSITGTVRKDGFSAFSLNKKWGVFPSVGLNWNISRENFMDKLPAINNLALRASYGSNGNQSINPYSTLAKMGFSKYIFYNDASYSITQYVNTLANNDLGWENTTGLNMGLDFSVLNNRLSGSVDGYNTKTTNLMFTLPLPTVSGKSSIVSNIGEIQNWGIEVNLNSINIEKKDFSWNTDFVFSLNRNKVVTILGQDNDGDGKEDDLISAGYFIGRPLGTIYNYKIIGMYQQADKDDGTIMTGMRPGDYILEDVADADGVKDGKITSDKDRQFLGNTNPNFRWSMTNTFNYKGFSLLVYLYSIWGGNGYYLSGSNTPYNDGYAGNGSVNHPVYDYWTPTNTGAMFPRLDYSRAAYRGTKYFDRSFIKLQKIALSYDLTKLVKPVGIYGLSCSLSADNLFTYAPHWIGLDPETNNGLTASSIPSIRTYLFSVTINF